MKIGVLHNPLSGRNTRRSTHWRAVFNQYSSGVFAEVVTPEDIKKALAHFADRKIDLVLISGGDGTIHATVGALLHESPFSAMPQLAVLPSGTANMIAGDVGLGPHRPETVVRLFNSALTGFVIKTRHILRITFSDARTPLHGMFFGAGAIHAGCQLGRDTKQSVGRFGEWGAGLIFAKFLVALGLGLKGRCQPVKVGLGVEGDNIVNEEYLALFVTTLDRLFLGMKPFWNPIPGPLHFTGLTVPYRYLWQVLPHVLRGKSHPLATKTNGYISRNVNSLRVTLLTGFMLDGEIYDPPGSGDPIVLESAGEVSFVQLPR